MVENGIHNTQSAKVGERTWYGYISRRHSYNEKGK